MQNYPSYDQIRNVNQQLVDMRYDYWLNHDLFSLQWWLLVAVLVIPWVLWWNFVDKEKIYDVLLFGSLLMVLVMMLDDLGVELQLWSYPYQLFYLMPRLIAVDQGIIIITHMFVYQYFKNWKGFIIANTVMAVVFTFIFEPLTVWLGIYRLENWEYIYSLPIYVLKVIIIKWLVDVVIQRKKISNS